MTRQRCSGLMVELARRMYLKDHNTLRGFGKIAKFYGREWRINFAEAVKYGVHSYGESWNCEPMKAIRVSLNM